MIVILYYTSYSGIENFFNDNKLAQLKQQGLPLLDKLVTLLNLILKI